MLKLFFCLFPYCLLSQAWNQLSDFPGSARDDATVFMINQKAFCVSGRSTGNCERDMYVFDCLMESWSNAASLPPIAARQYAGSFSWNGKGYLLCGVDCNNNLLKDFFRYDPVTDLWSGLPDFTGSARHGADAVVLNNKAYWIGGYNGSFLNEVWMFDLITETWTQKNNLPLSGFWRGASFVFNGKIYIAYGFTNNNNYNHHIYEYDELNDSWSIVTNIFLPARKYISCAVVNNEVFCYGGQDSLNTIINSLTIIDIISQTKSTLSGIPSLARKGGACFSYNNQFFVVTGLDENGNRTKEAWKHDGVVNVKQNENGNEMAVTIYPNPASENLQIISKREIKKFRVYTPQGILVYSSDFNKKEIVLDVNEFPSGIYFIQLFSDSMFCVQKFVVER